jgi:hypothetical protein
MRHAIAREGARVGLSRKEFVCITCRYCTKLIIHLSDYAPAGKFLYGPLKNGPVTKPNVETAVIKCYPLKELVHRIICELIGLDDVAAGPVEELGGGCYNSLCTQRDGSHTNPHPVTTLYVVT